MKFILGKKLGMSQIFEEKGKITPVTVIEAGPCFITQIKIEKSRKAPLKQRSKKDGHRAVQVGYVKLKVKKIGKSKKKKPYRFIKEFRITKHETGIKVDDKITVDVFKKGNIVKISGISKGKGFQGVVKRYGFSGGPASHGHRHDSRRIGSIGSAFPERVVKGRKMPGQTGGKRFTISGLKIEKIDSKNNLLAVKGAVPGPNGGLLEIKSSTGK